MKRDMRTFPLVLVSLFLLTIAMPWLNAQITRDLRAQVDHSFVIGNTTLPPGEYTFQLVQPSDITAMTVTNDKTHISVNFLVQTATTNHMPQHSELFFRKYGNTEVLIRIFQAGHKDGVEVADASRIEARLKKQISSPMEHTEEQK